MSGYSSFIKRSHPTVSSEVTQETGFRLLKGQWREMGFWPKQSLLVWTESIWKFLEFGSLLTKIRHNLAQLAL